MSSLSKHGHAKSKLSAQQSVGTAASSMALINKPRSRKQSAKASAYSRNNESEAVYGLNENSPPRGRYLSKNQSTTSVKMHKRSRQIHDSSPLSRYQINQSMLDQEIVEITKKKAVRPRSGVTMSKGKSRNVIRRKDSKASFNAPLTFNSKSELGQPSTEFNGKLRP